VLAGVSRPFPAGSLLDIPRREALSSLARAVDAGAGVVHYGTDPTERWLVDDVAALRGLVSHAFGAAATYDDEHGSDLVSTLRTWMEQQRDTAQTAKALGIHPNTVTYRLRCFEQLSGRDLSSTSDFAEIWLALVASQRVVPETDRPADPRS
jgi:PucR family transcriptional regulator, purine catabolism regulatory protein